MVARSGEEGQGVDGKGMSTFTKLYIAGWLFLIGVELVGVFWNFHDLDTMTASWRWLTARWPFLNIALFIGLAVLYWHLAIQKPK